VLKGRGKKKKEGKDPVNDLRGDLRWCGQHKRLLQEAGGGNEERVL